MHRAASFEGDVFLFPPPPLFFPLAVQAVLGTMGNLGQRLLQDVDSLLTSLAANTERCVLSTARVPPCPPRPFRPLLYLLHLIPSTAAGEHGEAALAIVYGMMSQAMRGIQQPSLGPEGHHMCGNVVGLAAPLYIRALGRVGKKQEAGRCVARSAAAEMRVCLPFSFHRAIALHNHF